MYFVVAASIVNDSIFCGLSGIYGGGGSSFNCSKWSQQDWFLIISLKGGPGSQNEDRIQVLKKVRSIQFDSSSGLRR
jgi:hypothetical protein